MLPEFRIYGQGISNTVPLEKLFERRDVPKVSASTKSQEVGQGDVDEDNTAAVSFKSKRLKNMYQAVEQVNRQPTLKAAQVMSSPVISLYASQDVLDASNILQADGFRHVPVLSHDHQLIGIISDRDIYQCMCAKGKQEVLIENIMTDHVLTANVDTDARYIARLFVERRVGSMPIIEDDKLVGIVTRSDILRAVMLNLHLDVWE